MAKKEKSKAKDKGKSKKSKKKVIKAKDKDLSKSKSSKKPKEKVKKKSETRPAQSSFSLLTDFDVHLFREGKHARLYEKMGSHEVEVEGVKGTFFAVWAPSAERVSVIGNFNHWDNDANVLNVRWDSSGIWEGFIPGIGHGEAYKYVIKTQGGGMTEKGDPFAHYWEEAPRTASIIWNSDYTWNDKKWLKKRENEAGQAKAMSFYEVHFGSWKRNIEDGNRSLTYGEMAGDLVAYLKEMEYTHVELLPVMEHPFYGSWGYQITGYYAPTSRYGSPQDFKYLVDKLHQAGIGIVLDWVPSHFPGDDHGLYKFDGTSLYEHEDPRKGFHPDWKSYIFNYGRNEIRSFLISNAVYWLDQYHIDGLRVDAVASMLYLDYSRKDGEWIPNEFGGNENIEAVTFLKEFNETVYREFPDTITIAEESTSWSMVSRPTYLGGLGFGQKWMMGWMHDSLEFFKNDPIHRKYHMNEITFSLMYAFTENFMLPLSHDEVVHGKGSILGRMPGDEWQKFANLRLLYGSMYTHPGTKLLFMGAEFGQYAEWNHESGLDWHLLDYEPHQGMKKWVADLNKFYKLSPALYELQFDYRGFEWLDYSDQENSIVLFMRKGLKNEDTLVIASNFTPTPRANYRIGVPERGLWEEVLNSDDLKYGGSGTLNLGSLKTVPVKMHGQGNSIAITIPPLGMSILKRTKKGARESAGS
jgi:1,4-alpha-glucan branching enzyme